MGQIFNKDFTAGYTPGDDYLNGRSNGHLRMDNLCLDENGALVLSKAPVNLTTAPAGMQIIAVYSKYLSGIRYRFVQYQDFTVWCDKTKDSNNRFIYNICGYGNGKAGPKPAAFGSGFGRIFISNGAGNTGNVGDTSATTENREFDGNINSVWGWQPYQQNVAPKLQFQQATCISFYGTNTGNWTNITSLVNGSNFKTDNGLATFSTSPANLGVLKFTPSSPFNLNQFTQAGSVQNVGNVVPDPGDTFNLVVNFPGGTPPTSIEVRACSSTSDTNNYYTHTFGPGSYSNIFNNWQLLQCLRSEFTATGVVNWNSIAMTEIRLTSSDNGTYSLSVPFEFYNGNNFANNVEAGLDGGAPITYVQQLITQLSGTSGKSPFSVPSRPVFGKWYAVGVIPQNPNNTVPIAWKDPRLKAIDIYRTGGLTSDAYYFIGEVLTSGGSAVVWDETSALELQAQNITSPNGIYLSNIPPGIIGIEGPINGRMALMTSSGVQFTDFMNSESIDDRLTIIPSASADESCLFISRVSNTVLLLATTQDFYEISGTFTDLSDGTFDIAMRSAGIKQPAISGAHCNYDNTIIYIASSGVRQLAFSLSTLMSQELTLLFKGQDCFGVQGLLVEAADTDTYGLRWALSQAHQKIYVRVTHRDRSTMSTFVYDVNHQNWYRRTDTGSGASLLPLCFYSEEDGTVLVGCADGIPRLYENNYCIDTVYNQNIYYQSHCHETEKPLARKDLYTLKLWMATGSNSVTVTLQDEYLNQAIIAQAVGVNGTAPQQLFLPVHATAVDLSQRFCLIITDAGGGGVPYFKLEHWSLDYGERPDPELFLYIPPNNFGTPTKKRVRTLPMIIDTRNNVVTYQPIVDNVSVFPPSKFLTSTKQTVYHLFDDDQFGIDYGGTLTANGWNPFEFYGLMQPVSVEELPPPKLFDQVGPYALDKKGKIYGFRIRMVSFTTSINYTIYGDDTVLATGSFTTTPGIDTTYEVLRVPPGLLANVVRIEFTSPDNTKPFMRWYVQLRYVAWGMGTDEKWATLAGKVGPTE